METNRIYRVAFGSNVFDIDNYMWYRLKNWAVEKKIPHYEMEYAQYTAESYSEETKENYGGDEAPETIKRCIHFEEENLKDFIEGMRYFSWHEE